VVSLGQRVFSPDELSVFLEELRSQPSANRGKASWESLGLRNVRTDPRLSDQSVGLSIASRIASRGLVQNPGMHRYVNLVAATLAASSPLYDWDINVYLLEGDKPVTYAVPGGYVFLSLGAVHQCRNEAEIAAMVGHEIGALVASFALQEATERTALNVIDETFRELDEEVEKIEQERADVEALVDNTYKKVIGPRSLKTLMDADRIGAVLCAAAGYDPFVAVEMAGASGRLTSEEETQEEEVGVDAKKRQDALKKFCVKRFVTKDPGTLMTERFVATVGTRAEH
jgi:predicted Zn-dependent protease